jgi:hypothetical protein
MSKAVGLLCVGALIALAACGDEAATTTEGGALDITQDDVTKVEPGKEDSSAEAIFVDMAFEGELITDTNYLINSQIDKQLLYTIGHLNGDRAVGRLDKVQLSEIKFESVEGGIQVRYKASIQVAWGQKDNVPATYDLILPRDVSYKGLEAFTEAYSHDCVDFGAHDVDSGSMWYYYRPRQRRCALKDADVIRSRAAVTVSPVNTTGKYPEYDKVWEDGVFQVVAVFGKYEDGATSGDAGIDAYNTFTRLISGQLASHGLKTTPEVLPASPGVQTPEITMEAQLDAEHRVVVHAILVDNVRSAGPAFDQRYGELSTRADFIVYNGHAGLGANIRALANKGQWVQGQYAVVFMNGCDTYAYVDSALFDAHAEVNPDDEFGTKHLDLVANALPAFFVSMPRATIAIFQALVNYDQPLNYEQIFKNVDDSQVVLVTGEQDNTFTPGGGAAPVNAWDGLSLEGTLGRGEERRFETPALPAGSYVFEMEGTGDADLYVRVGLQPDLQSFDCRPYKNGTRESCKLELSAPAPIFGLIQGYRDATFTLSAKAN